MNQLFINTIAEICFQRGVKSAILSPGSRCAPLSLAFIRHPKISTRTISDERSAGYIALGMAQHNNQPTAKSSKKARPDAEGQQGTDKQSHS